MTGADSPVMADSSTDATPSMMSPSPGMVSPAETMTTSPERSLAPDTVSIRPSGRSRLACVSDFARRSVSACALPRPSAMASAKFANSTVNHSQSVIWRSKPKPGLWRAISLNSSTVVITLPTSTTNMTGLRIIFLGFNLRHESISAWRTIFASHNDFDLLDVAAIGFLLESLSCVHKQVLKNGSQAQRREECQSTNNDDHAHQECSE